MLTKEKIANQFAPVCGFKNCVELIDATLFPFECNPTLNGEDYTSCKLGCPVNALITCDVDARVQDIVIGQSSSI